MNAEPINDRIRRVARRELRTLAWRAIQRVANEVTVDTPLGRYTVSTRDQVIGRLLFTRKDFEGAWMRAIVDRLRLLGYCPPDGTLVDVGGNIGPTTIALLRMGLARRSIAIEPDPDNADLFRRNVEANHLSGRVTVVQMAASDSPGTLHLARSETNMGDHRIGAEGIPVEARTLDAIMADHPDAAVSLVWIDVQGHELAVWRGAQQLFARAVPVVCEIWPQGLRRAGTDVHDFVQAAISTWTHYDVMRRGTFVRYPIATFGCLIDELVADEAENVLFTRQ